MVVIVGLGNPGRRYARTRHNVGFMVVDALAEKLKCGFRAANGEYEAAACSFRDQEVVLAKPVTFMNESGIALVEIVEQYKPGFDRLLVVVDDFQIPLGSLRLRPAGSDGGHNGLASIIYQLQSDAFPRLRCGIGSGEMPADKSLMADFVLSGFSETETPAVEEMIGRASDACLGFATDGIEKTMSQFNRTGD